MASRITPGSGWSGKWSVCWKAEQHVALRMLLERPLLHPLAQSSNNAAAPACDTIKQVLNLTSH